MPPHILLDLASPILAVVDPPSWGELGVYFGAIVAVGGVIYTATVTGRTGREANAVNFSNTLMKRLDDLEEGRDADRKERDAERKERDAERKADRAELKQVREAQEATDKKLNETMEILSIAMDFITALYSWGRKGGGEPEPTIPGQLRDWLGHLIHDKDHH